MPVYDRRCTACSALRLDCFEPMVPPVDRCGACGAPTERVWLKATSIISDEWPGGKTFENGFESPRTFYSPSEYKRALAENGFQIKDGHAEVTHAWMSKETIENAIKLVSR